jgi:hypothetical protein
MNEPPVQQLRSRSHLIDIKIDGINSIIKMA